MTKKKTIPLPPNLGKDLAKERGVRAKPTAKQVMSQEELLDLTTAHNSSAELIADIHHSSERITLLADDLAREREILSRLRERLATAKATINALEPRL